MEEAIQKASVLVEALPYIRSFHDKVIVIKYGGSAIDDAELHNVLLSVAFMTQVGMLPVLVHGGGKFITQELERRGVKTRFVHGHRYTDEETLRVVEDVLVNTVNRKLVKAIQALGNKAVSLTSTKVRCLRAERLTVSEAEGPDRHGESLGFVGRVTGADADRIRAATADHTVPVIAPLATGPDGEVLNCNADSAASVIAASMKAEKLVLLTDVPGIMVPGSNGQPKLVHRLTEAQAEKSIASGHISGGMTPKVKACIAALDAGVRRAHIIDGRVPHSLLVEIFTKKGVGTLILHGLGRSRRNGSKQ